VGTYASLSTIARAITGTAWNGPRFFGRALASIARRKSRAIKRGRLTLNVLLSFAQFEREVIGERLRDKIAASKRKGIWVRSPVPLGHRRVDKKLVVVSEEAEAVRTILARYLALGSVGALMADLDRRGIRTKANGRQKEILSVWRR